MNKVYLFVENLPKLITKKEIFTFFKNKLQPPQEIFHFNFRGSSFFYDLQAALLSFKFDNPDNAETLEKSELILNGYKLRVSIKNEITEFQSTLIFYDIAQSIFKNNILPTIPKFGFSSIFQINTESQSLTGYIIRFSSVSQAKGALSCFHEYNVEPILKQKNYNYSLPNSTFKVLPKMSALFDFFLIYFGKRYGVFRCLASKLSETIDACQSNEIVLPNYEGPISLIIDYLNLQEIVISPETENFINNMASFLGIPGIIQKLSKSNQQSMCIANANSLIHVIIPGSHQYDDFCTFLASNIEDLISEEKLSDIPLHYAQKIVELAAPTLESHDALVQLVINVNFEGQAKRELTKYIDPKKVSTRMLAKFFKFSNFDLNKIRDFVEKAIFGE